jgi:hypothetical protein
MAETSQARRLKHWNNLTPEQRDYDRFVARTVPFGASRLPETAKGRAAQAAMWDVNDPERGCSCHILPPCSYCESLIECEECGEWVPGEDEMTVHLDAKHPLPVENGA